MYRFMDLALENDLLPYTQFTDIVLINRALQLWRNLDKYCTCDVEKREREREREREWEENKMKENKKMPRIDLIRVGMPILINQKEEPIQIELKRLSHVYWSW